MTVEGIEVDASGANSVAQEDAGQCVSVRTESSALDPFVQAGRVQLMQKVAVSMRMLSTDCKRLSSIA